MLEQYERYLEIIDKSLQKFFAEQSPYIFCKEGCAICCETGEYPFSQLEFQYAMLGYNNLAENEKAIIKEKIEKIIQDKMSSTDKVLMYECPFLIDKKCSIYNHRGIICRNYGLMYYEPDADNKLTYKIPYCIHNGLNYSNVYDEKTGMISSAKWRETGLEVEPNSYNVGRSFLLNNNMTKELELEFGESKALIDWLL